MGWRRRRQKIFKVLVVGRDKEIRQRLIDYYFMHIKHHCALNANDKLYRAKNPSEVWKKINERFFRPDLVVFSQEFSEEERDQLKEQLSYIRMATPFITAPLEPPVKVA